MPEGLLSNSPALASLVDFFERYFEEVYPDFFGKNATHPVLPVKRSKIIHDSVWGTNEFLWPELALIDSPVLQRLRDIHQVGLAWLVYPTATHSRFEHSLGTAVIATRTFDNLRARQGDTLASIARTIDSRSNPEAVVSTMREELRLACLLHDSGHTLFSHTSETAHGLFPQLKQATEELSTLLSKDRSTGETLSFCIALTPALRALVQRASRAVYIDGSPTPQSIRVDFENVALMIVGASKHPYTQFLADVVTSGFDADKLDYLLRDASAAGLPIKYDMDRYLVFVEVRPDYFSEKTSASLGPLYGRFGVELEGLAVEPGARPTRLQTYRTRLPIEAVTSMEQIVICKFMLFNYIYHHSKVRAAEGMVEHALRAEVLRRLAKEDSSRVLAWFFGLSDSDFLLIAKSRAPKPTGADPFDSMFDCAYRIANRLLPREIFHLGSSQLTHADATQLLNFMARLQDREQTSRIVKELEEKIGANLLRDDPTRGSDPFDALQRACIWVDVPKPPRFEGVDELIGSSGTDGSAADVPLSTVFPIHRWAETYLNYSYEARIFSSSEMIGPASSAAADAVALQAGISSAGCSKLRRRRL